MPTQSAPTMAVVLGLDGDPMREQLAAAAKECMEVNLRERIALAFVPGFWSKVGRDIETLVAKELGDVSLDQVLVDGWLKYRELRAFADPATHPRGEPNTVELAEHSFTWPHTIDVTLCVGGVERSTLSLDLEVELALHGVVLGILDGRIRSISLGSVDVSATVECKGRRIKRFPLRKLEVPELELPRPIPLVTPDPYAYARAVTAPVGTAMTADAPAPRA